MRDRDQDLGQPPLYRMMVVEALSGDQRRQRPHTEKLANTREGDHDVAVDPDTPGTELLH